MQKTYKNSGKHAECKTFNGLSFDVPTINRCFNSIVPKIPHLGLRFPLRRLGYTGGLKLIEERLNVKRSEATQGLSGFDAVRLWNNYVKKGDQDALNLLVEYNTEDIINLKPLAEFVFNGMKSEMLLHFKR
ncbi:ribonuclease H-like domain-containing protein [archaeon]|nr:ribonuclease H-like domain-containing protein [archaeon]